MHHAPLTPYFYIFRIVSITLVFVNKYLLSSPELKVSTTFVYIFIQSIHWIVDWYGMTSLLASNCHITRGYRNRVCNMFHHRGILMATTWIFHCSHFDPSQHCCHSSSHMITMGCCWQQHAYTALGFYFPASMECCILTYKSQSSMHVQCMTVSGWMEFLPWWGKMGMLK